MIDTILLNLHELRLACTATSCGFSSTPQWLARRNGIVASERFCHDRMMYIWYCMLAHHLRSWEFGPPGNSAGSNVFL